MDSLSSAEQVESPVAASESPLFRRKYSMVYDALESGKVSVDKLRETLYRNQPEESGKIAGYEVYPVDCTEAPHPEAETRPDRTHSKKGRYAPKVIGHRYFWLVRVVSWKPSWCMAQDVERVSSDKTDSQVGAEQVKR